MQRFRFPVLILFALCQSTFAGWELLWKNTNVTDLDNPRESKTLVSVMRILLDGPRLRMEVVESPAPEALRPGTYWICANAGRDGYWVDPTCKGYRSGNIGTKTWVA